MRRLYNEEGIGEYLIPQYRKKNWKIAKYRVENRRNTDTAFMIGHAYLRSYPSREFDYLKQSTSAIASLKNIDLHIIESRAQMNSAAIPWKIFFYRIPLAKRMKIRIPQ